MRTFSIVKALKLRGKKEKDLEKISATKRGS